VRNLEEKKLSSGFWSVHMQIPALPESFSLVEVSRAYPMPESEPAFL
jgi:hypothetical protein